MSNVGLTPQMQARQLLRYCGITRPEHIDIEDIALSLGASVQYKVLLGEQGRLARSLERGSPQISVSKNLKAGQRRFVIGHELGHLQMHPNLDQFKQCSAGDLQQYHGSGVEAEANCFAAELLMPQFMFEPLCDISKPSLKDIWLLADRFGTSKMAAGIQFINYYPRPVCAFVFSKNGIIQWASRQYNFPFKIDRGRELTGGDAGCYAGDLFDNRTAPDSPQPVDAKNWTPFIQFHGQDVFEHSRIWTSTGNRYVLSLLTYRGF